MSARDISLAIKSFEAVFASGLSSSADLVKTLRIMVERLVEMSYV